MHLRRRRALGLGLAAWSTAVLQARADGTVSDDRAVFWKIGSGTSASTIFGYERIAASLVPDIVGEGTRKAISARRLILDFPPSVVLPPIKLDPSLPPLIERLDATTADAFRAVVQKSFAQFLPTIDKMSGTVATFLLMAEGQRPPNPTVGGTIFEHALQAGRPATALISGAELRSTASSHNLTASDKRIGQDTIAYLLELRRRGGPIGRQFEQLYATRRSGDIQSLAADLARRSVFGPSQVLNGDMIKAILAGRLDAALKASEADSAFILLPLGALLGSDGILAALRKGGNTVTAAA